MKTIDKISVNATLLSIVIFIAGYYVTDDVVVSFIRAMIAGVITTTILYFMWKERVDKEKKGKKK